MAGVYSSAHPLTIDGVKVTTNGYVEIDREGHITAFEQDGEGPASVGSGCYRLAAGTATNAGLQERILTPGVSPRGDAVYQTRAGDDDTFGILVEPAANGEMRWFFHSGGANSTITITGTKNVVNATNRSSYSISGPALASPTPEQLRNMLCHADTSDLPQVKPVFAFRVPRPGPSATHADPGVAAAASSPVASDGVHPPALPAGDANPSPLAAALPFELGKPVDAATFARLGISPGSSKERMLKEWAQKIGSDPDIKAYFSTATGPSAAGAAMFTHLLGVLDGMQRISQQDRERLNGITTLALDNAPPDCGGIKNLPAVTKRYLSLGTESDKVLEGQLQAMFDLLKQSTQSTPPPQLTAAQRLQAQLALNTSIADALKRDPAETSDLALLMSGKQADLTPEAWCRATRLYRKALDKTPQPARDWILLTEIENQRHAFSMLVTMLTKIAPVPPAGQQPGAAPKVFSYAELVQQRVRPHIIWDGKVVHGETVVAVLCTPSGMLESAKIVHSSGDADWDSAALKAVMQSDPMPLDETGRALRSFDITLRPGI